MAYIWRRWFDRKTIYTKIKKRLIGHFYENQLKSIVKGNLNGIFFKSVHYPHIKSKVPSQQFLSDGTKIPRAKIVIKNKNKEPAYINHYMTKTNSRIFWTKII